MTAMMSIRVLGLALGRALGEILELLFGHAVFHLLRGALEFRLGRIAALGAERGAGGFLLGFRFGWHGLSPLPPRQQLTIVPQLGSSEERRVGNECVSTCRSGWAPTPSKKTESSK